MQKATEFIGTCVGLPAHLLDAFDEISSSITNRTFRKHLGHELYSDLEKGLGYGRNKGLYLSKDWHVSYTKGKWQGKTAICLFWSGIHHIWIIP